MTKRWSVIGRPFSMTSRSAVRAADASNCPQAIRTNRDSKVGSNAIIPPSVRAVLTTAGGWSHDLGHYLRYYL